jgi:hypothetical protein
VHKRSSMSHVYSHCVVIHFAAHPPSKFWPKGIVAHSHAEWVPHLSSADKISIKNLVRDMAYKEPGAGCAQVHEINLDDILGSVS